MIVKCVSDDYFFFLNYYEKRKEIIRDKEEENCVLQGLGRDKETIKTLYFDPIMVVYCR